MSLDIAHETPFYKIYRLPVCILALILKTDWINFRHSKDTSRRTILICKIASLSVWLIHEKMKSWVDHDEDVSTISECFSNKMTIDSDINTMYSFSTPMKPTTLLPNSNRWNVGSIFVSFRIWCFVNLKVFDFVCHDVWLILTVDFMMLCGIFFLNEGFEEGRFSGIYI